MLTADIFAGIARLKYRGRPADLRAMGRLLKAKVMLGGWSKRRPALRPQAVSSDADLVRRRRTAARSVWLRRRVAVHRDRQVPVAIDGVPADAGYRPGLDKSATPAVAVAPSVAPSPAPVTAPAPMPVPSRPTAVTSTTTAKQPR